VVGQATGCCCFPNSEIKNRCPSSASCRRATEKRFGKGDADGGWLIDLHRKANRPRKAVWQWRSAPDMPSKPSIDLFGALYRDGNARHTFGTLDAMAGVLIDFATVYLFA